MKRSMSTALASLLVVLLTLSGALAGCGPGPSASASPAIPTAGVTLSPIRSDASGVDPTAGFYLASAASLSLSQVERLLTVSPAVELRYEQADKDGKLFTIQTARALDADQVYRFKLAPGQGVEREYQWSFQTRADFRVLGVLPRHQATHVPLDTGIEITFSHEGFADVDGLFTIEPKVEGRFERHKKTVAFLPKEKLQPGTVYTVTLKPGLGLKDSELKLEHELRFAFETESTPDAEKREAAWVNAPTEPLQFAEATAPYMPVEYYSPSRGRELATVNATLYRYRGATQFIEALMRAGQVPWWSFYGPRQYQEETRGLSRVSSFETKLQELAGHYSSYLLFPEKLAPGYYLAELKIGEQSRQVRFQVSDLTSHLTVAENESLLWVNDLITGAPVSGAEVSHPGGKVRTASDGTARFATPSSFGGSDSEGLYLTVKSGVKEAVVAVRPGGYFFYDMAYRGGIWPPWPSPVDSAAVDYWKYLYTDRGLYQPSDTVQIFGVLKPREPGVAEPSKVTASLIRREYRGWDERPVPLVKADLTLTESTFGGSLTLPNLKPGQYELQIQADGAYVASRWIQVEAYTKPAYTVTLTPERQAIFQDESVDFTLSATFFEGTPVPNLTFSYTVNWASEYRQQQVTTGPDGTATIRFTPGGADPYGGGIASGYPISAYLRIHASLPEAGEISSSASVQVFPRDITFQPKVEVSEGGKATIEVQANRVDLDKLNSGDSWNHTGAALAGAKVDAVLTEITWERYTSGEYYDFVAKKVVQTYEYREVRRDAGRFSLTTDGEGKATHQLSIDPEKSYQVRLTMHDTKGKAVTQDHFFSGRFYKPMYWGRNDYRWYHLAPVDQRHEGWNVGEKATLRVMEGHESPAEDRAKGFLFYEARKGLRTHAVQDSATYSLTLKEADLPNTNLRAVYFDGQRYWDVSEYAVRFNPLHRQLKVEVTPDQEVYRPGEPVGVTVKVTDKQGRPVRAQLNLSLVDEALFALRGDHADLLGALYGDWVPAGILRSASGTVLAGDGAARAGALGESADMMFGAPQAVGSAAPSGQVQVRSDFRDTAWFTTIATDDSGQGQANFTLPHNLTTWRLTYQAFAPGIIGGATGTAPITVKLPFFVDMVVAGSYLAGDQPVISVRSYGTDLSESAEVSYRVSITRPDGSRFERQATGKPFAPAMIPLERLEAGTYTVQVEGRAGSLADAMEQQVTVVETYLKQPKVDFHLLRSGMKLQGADTGLTRVTFTDYHRGRYYHLLERLSWSSGNRFEQRLASTVAAQLLEQHFGQERYWKDESWSPLNYQTPDGSVAILPYADGELYLSALVADLAPDMVDRGALASYFEQLLESGELDREQATLAIYGLAALDKPVLNHVKALLAAKDLTTTERLNLALAATTLADLEGARPAWQALWHEHGERLGANARLKLGRDQDEILNHTAQAAILAARLGEPEAFALVGYLLENHASEVLLDLKLLLVAQAILPGLAEQPVGFTAIVGGEERTVELKPGQTLSWHLTAEQVASMQIRSVQGEVGITSVYEAPLSAADIRQEPGYELYRSYEVVNRRGATQWQAGDLIRITMVYKIPETAPGGVYEVTDYLPAGLKLIQRPWQHGIEWRSGKHLDPAWPMAVDGQRISFWAWEDGYPISYYARVVTAGEYTAEQPALQHMRSGVIYKLGQREQVRIGQ